MEKQLLVKNRKLITVIILSATFISMMSQTMMVTALPLLKDIMKESLTTVQWLTTGYTLMVGVVTPLTSNVYEKYSSRTVFLSLLLVFSVGTSIGAIAPNFWFLLLGRLLQAAAGGFLMAFQMTTMMTIYPPSQRGMIMGLSTFVIAFGPAVGPTVAGIILNYLNWRYLFISILPIMLLILLISFWRFPNYSQPKPVKIDFISVIESFLSISLIMLSITMMKGQLILGIFLFILGFLIGCLLLKRQLRMKKPLINIYLLKQPTFVKMTGISILAYIILVGLGQLVSIFAQMQLSVDSLTAGLILLPGAILNAFSSIVVGRIYDKHGPKKLIITGSFLMLVSFIPFFLSRVEINLALLSVTYALCLLGIGLIFSPSLTEAFKEIEPSQISQATALNNTLRQMFASIGITIMISIVTTPSSMNVGITWVMALCIVLTIAIPLLLFRLTSEKK